MNKSLESLGFKYGISGTHASRSMMIAELTELLNLHPNGAELKLIKQDIIDFNVLHKNTENSRKLTYGYLVDLYTLDNNVCLFRNFLKLWQQANTDYQPLLALQLAFCRDALLRVGLPILQNIKLGEPYSKAQTIELLEEHNPGRYSTSSANSFAQNINGSLTQAGFLQGRSKKIRSQPKVGAVNVAFALFIAHLNGDDGSIALNNQWVKMLGIPQDEVIALAHNAHSRGIIKFSHASDVMEIRFPNWLTETEKELINA
tara:strand:+ start:15468 stop:16244 length:777 start_codon:yes stop_codon:yes gene_type:complete